MLQEVRNISGYYINDANNIINNANANILEYNFAQVVQDPDNIVKYIKVVSSEEFNSLELRNDTLYFINDINEEVSEVTDILDIALSNYGSEDGEPNTLWVLTVDYEMEMIYLWSSAVNKGLFTIRKVWKGFKNGAMAFDGTWDYVRGKDYSVLFTEAEPFVALIRNDDKLFAFPSLNYKTNGGTYEAKLIAPAESDPEATVTYVSVDKGYGSKLFKDTDMGMVICFIQANNGSYKIAYSMYTYPSEDTDTKELIGPETIFTQNEAITQVTVQRLNDYRVGITYNYNKTVDNILTYKTGFRYSRREYSGVAFHPEFFEIENKFRPSSILYGAVRTDNKNTVPVPRLALENDRRDNSSTLYFQLGLGSEQNPQLVKLEALNPNDPNSKGAITLFADAGFEVVNDYPYGYYEVDGTPSKAEIEWIRAEGTRLIVKLMGDKMPLTPFVLKPNYQSTYSYLLRFDGSADKQQQYGDVKGWFAFTNGTFYEYKKNPKRSWGASADEIFWGLGTSTFLVDWSSCFYATFMTSITIGVELGFYHSTYNNNHMDSVQFITPTLSEPYIRLNVTSGYSNVMSSGGIIDV